jgi:hypothetical protein
MEALHDSDWGLVPCASEPPSPDQFKVPYLKLEARRMKQADADRSLPG